jgi:purine-nucleoside phosphorylase
LPTPHIAAEPGDFAPACLLPGDPRRAVHIATNFLDDAREVTAVRNMTGFTGTYRGVPVSVMGTGMGIPSAMIYAHELISDYGVRHLVRVGSCGALPADVGVGDVVLAMGACTDSGVNRTRFGGLEFAATADYALPRAAADAAASVDRPVHVGNVFSADFFYHPDPGQLDTLESMGVLAIEMEAAGLYGLAAAEGAAALAVLTVSDHIRSGVAQSSAESEKNVTASTTIALEAALAVTDA